LDAQYFGVAQRRRRVFVVGYLGDWRRAAAVLFERESMLGHPAPRRETREEVAGYTSGSFGGYHQGVGTVRAAGGDLGGGSETLVAKNLTKNTRTSYSVRDDVTPKAAKEIVGTLSARDYKGAQAVVNTITASYGMGGVDYETKPLVFGAQNSSSQGDSVSEHVTPTLDKSKTPAVAYGIPGNWIGRKPENGGNSTTPMYEMSPNLTVTDKHGVSRDMRVRRLLPIECERLQGFPDNYTQIAWRNKAPEDCPDGPRYKAMGNSMAVPVMRWIGERIQMVEDMTQ
jgi:DNA (cytosine-5)-methyltransferase 1